MTALMWFRRDLRLNDNAALHQALARHERVHCAFVFDPGILDTLLARGRASRRVAFMLAAIVELNAELHRHGGALILRHGPPDEQIPALAAELGVTEVLANRDYDPAAIARDAHVAQRLATAGRYLRCFKDQVIFECDEVMSKSGKSFSVFTPYKNAWLKRLRVEGIQTFDIQPHLSCLAPSEHGAPLAVPALLAGLGFSGTNPTSLKIPTGASGAQRLLRDFVGRLDRYAERRDYPALKGPSYLSPHLRFGTISIRQLAGYAQVQTGRGAEAWLNELIWRDFYQMILWHHPHVVTQAFKPQFDALQWDDAPELFTAWCAGCTGYPLVDAAMRQLNQSGWMHNRLRMVTASFLTKDLGIDWRLGERYFGEQLIDYDLAANNGGWQWAASTGCDAQPWFRMFNPVTQSEKFDASGKFIRRYVPALAQVPDKFIHAPWQMNFAQQREARMEMGKDYPLPIVDHAAARARTLARFDAVRK